MAKQVFFKRKKSCPFSGEDALIIDYKDVKLLSRNIQKTKRKIENYSIFYDLVLSPYPRNITFP